MSIFISKGEMLDEGLITRAVDGIPSFEEIKALILEYKQLGPVLVVSDFYKF